MKPSLPEVVFAAVVLAAGTQLSSSQTFSRSGVKDSWTGRPSFESICKARAKNGAQAAMQKICERTGLDRPQLPLPQLIVVGFVGGFADPGDAKHPEVLFATYLREHYSGQVHAEVFSNHDGKGALRYVTGLLDINHDAVLSEKEKDDSRIIIYGHSWGASETAAFARELQHYAIPVLLTIQLDIVAKHGQKPSRIPQNVESAVNFFQSEGLLQGRPKIIASEGSRTQILGNFRMTYMNNPINCDNYPWLARTFNKPHHEIENDPVVWDQIASLIDTEISLGDHSQNAGYVVTRGLGYHEENARSLARADVRR